MNLYFFTEARFERVNGEIWCHSSFSMDLWQRYIQSFNHVYIACRVKHTTKHSDDNTICLKSKDVTVIDLPYYVGIWGYVKKHFFIKKAIKAFIHKGDAYICRVPGTIGTIASGILEKRNIPYGVEIVGDPMESLAQISNPFISNILKRIGSKQLKKITWNASAALYVTQNTLQSRYVVKKGIFTTGASNVILKDNCYSASPHKVRQITKGDTINILCIGSLAQMYKAPDIILKALASIKTKGYNPFLTWYGDGKYKHEMVILAKELGIENNVNFAGSVDRDTIQNRFETTDLFVHASRTEGLPRAVVEAMAFGLPCIGSSIAGIPELLSKESLVQPNNVNELANRILKFVCNTEFAQEEANNNWNESKKFHEDILTRKRESFYDELKHKSEL